MSIRKYGGRYWALYDAAGELVCVCLYKRGAAEVLRRLQQLPAPPMPPTQGDRILSCPGEHCEQMVFVKTTEQSFLSQTDMVQ
jgi:hypothetical protein